MYNLEYTFSTSLINQSLYHILCIYEFETSLCTSSYVKHKVKYTHMWHRWSKYLVRKCIQGHPECVFEPKSPWIGSLLTQLAKNWKHVAHIHILCIDSPDWASWTLKGQELNTISFLPIFRQHKAFFHVPRSTWKVASQNLLHLHQCLKRLPENKVILLFYHSCHLEEGVHLTLKFNFCCHMITDHYWGL